MRAAVVEEQGASPRIVEIGNPTPRDGGSVIDVAVAAIGPTDLYKAAGTHRPFPGRHIVNGEGVGYLGGSRVYFGHSVLPYGSWAEQTLVSDTEIWPVPDGVEDEQAAALGISGTGALIPLEQAAIQPGERVLVLGATGVLGQIGLQIAREMGAGLLVAAGRNTNVLGKILQRGWADEIVTIGRGADFAALQAAAGEGWNVVLDVLFGEPAVAAIKTTAMGARIVSVSRMASSTITFDLKDLGFRTLSGVGTGIRPAAERKAAFARLMAMAAAGKLRVDVSRFGFDQVAEAWATQQAGAYSKIVAHLKR